MTHVKSLQILLQNSILGNTVDETEGLIKRHEAFEKLLSSQEEKVSSVSGIKITTLSYFHHFQTLNQKEPSF